MIAGFKFLG